ncbi:zinc-binding alcohol dehydrogenase family protein [Kitasatospora xanthocidica]|uniref:Zinc-binding alcohol dehydrogenase family protein n=1 Tax=Kitasatospora xanthocidica TaxID=83382 RepID=A0A373A251_9ACTN|nr:zinc-binding alcohol dehydrogenase family protein [Kitasatospora xanthocidica]RGD62141.1 zinc-binding alcohol dehydrogenase family protein [Kitasatospora xanthocidica]
MDAAVLHTLGKPPRFERFPEPTAGEGEVLVQVLAAALNPSTKAVAGGGHFASSDNLPAVVGLDGVGRLEDGSRVFFGGARKPYGSMAQLTVARAPFTWPVPDGVDDLTAAALPNPALSSWIPLEHAAKLQPGETVLVLGATGAAGKLAIQIAKHLGAGRVVAAGRNQEVLDTLGEYGADATVPLNGTQEEMAEAFAAAAGDTGYDVILDYLWGKPTEALLTAMTRKDFHLKSSGPRLVQIGESAGATIELSAGTIRSAGLTIVGGGFPPPQAFLDMFNRLMAGAAAGEIRIDTRAVPLAEIEQAWQAEDTGHKRLVIVP